MNLDRLLKLLKLANHNPNDAEANSAARLACKMLGEDNYKWIENTKPRTAADKVGTTGNSGTWGDVKRSSTPFWDDINDIINKTRENAKREQERYAREYQGGSGGGGKQEQQENDFKKGFYSGVDWDSPPKEPPKTPPRTEWREPMSWTWSGEEPDNKVKYKKTYTPVLRDCSDCDKSKLTTDETIPYVCSDCKWTKYNKERENANKP